MSGPSTHPRGPAGVRPGGRTIDLPKFVCPRCGKISYNETDIEQGYCGDCHDWTGDPGWTSS